MKTHTFTHLLILFIGIMYFLFACTPSNKKPANDIKDLEKLIAADTTGKLIQTKGAELLVMYMNYYKKFPKDTITPEYLFKSCKIMINTSQAELAFNWLDTVKIKYPSYKRLPECLFLQAFICENYLMQFGRAKDIYTEFLKKYPDNDLSDDAEASIANIGKSPEQLVKEFETKQDASAITKK